eukprot:768408-Hanusia_phi.AAC.5
MLLLILSVAGYECPTGNAGFYDAPADYNAYLEMIGVSSRKFIAFASSDPLDFLSRLTRFLQLPLPTPTLPTARETDGPLLTAQAPPKDSDDIVNIRH